MKYKFLAFATLFLASLSVYADLKVGFVQVDKILQEAPQTIESNKKLEMLTADKNATLTDFQN